MQSTTDFTFHLSIPCQNLDQAQRFYVELLGCTLVSRTKEQIILNFFDHQLTCHLAPDQIDLELRLYSRNLGMILYSKLDWEKCRQIAMKSYIPLFEIPHIRFEHLPERYWTFSIIDPSNNVLEIKHYGQGNSSINEY
jgi:uncharacterized protein